MYIVHAGTMLINIQMVPHVTLQISHERLKYEFPKTLVFFFPFFHNHTDIKFSSQVRFVCSEPRPMISSITELSTCKYALTIQCPTLCKHP